MQFYEFKETQERVILIGVQTEVRMTMWKLLWMSLKSLPRLPEQRQWEGDPEQRGSPSWNLYR